MTEFSFSAELIPLMNSYCIKSLGKTYAICCSPAHFLTCLALVYAAKTRRQWLSEFLNEAFGYSGMRANLMAHNTVPRQSWKEMLKITAFLVVDVEFLCNAVPSKVVQLCSFKWNVTQRALAGV